jgi:hypothetical protein
MKAAFFGATKNLGRFAARFLAEQGHTLFLLGTDEGQLKSSVADLAVRSRQDEFSWACCEASNDGLARGFQTAKEQMADLDTIVLAFGPNEIAEPLAVCEAANQALSAQGGGALTILVEKSAGAVYQSQRIGIKHYVEEQSQALDIQGIRLLLIDEEKLGSGRSCSQALSKGRLPLFPWIPAFFRRAQQRIVENPFDSLIVLGLFLTFFALYFCIATDFRGYPRYSTSKNIFFDADHEEAIAGWVKNHKAIHPLMLMIVVPLSAALSSVSTSYEAGLMLFCGLLGGLTIALFYGLCRQFIEHKSTALATALVFGLSMGQLFFASLPDSYELVVLCLIPTYILAAYCLKEKRLCYRWWIVVGLLAFGITMTNAAQTGIAFIVVSIVVLKRQRLRKLIAFVFWVTVFGILLNLIQKGLIPDSRVFWDLQTYSHEMQYTSSSILEDPALIGTELVTNFFTRAFVGDMPKAVTYIADIRLRLTYFETPMRFPWVGMAALALWFMLLFRGAVINLSDSETRPFTVIALVSILANLCLHSFYGVEEMMLYTPHCAFVIVLLAVGPKASKGALIGGAWWVLAILLAFNNLTTLDQMSRRFAPKSRYQTKDMIPVIGHRDRWRYHLGKTNPGSNWNQLDFNDKGWPGCWSPIGYGDGDDATIIGGMKGRYSTIFMRRGFGVRELQSLKDLWVDVLYDDGFVLYLNGKLLAYKNAPKILNYRSLASRDHEAVYKERFHIDIAKIRKGRNVLAVVGLNRSKTSSDFTLTVEMTRVGGD